MIAAKELCKVYRRAKPAEGKPDQKCSRIPHPIYGKRVCEPSGKKPANLHET